MRAMWIAGLLLSAALDQAGRQPPRPSTQQLPPPATGQRVMVGDGDLVVAENGARVRLIRRTDANVRAIYNAADRWLVLLVDAASPDGRAPDGGVETTYTFNDLVGQWPLGERWERAAVVEDYTMLGSTPVGPHGAGLMTANGLVQLLSRNGGETFRDAAATATLVYGGVGRGGGGNLPFGAAESQQVAVAIRNATRSGRMPGNFSSSVGMTIEPVPGAGTPGVGAFPPPSAPVRVGGNIRTPAKIAHVAPVMPPQAAQANIHGVVILEIVIGPDGAVSDAKVLRSIPLLDRAALDAVAKWRYEPTLLNGMPVPVIMTVTVSF